MMNDPLKVFRGKDYIINDYVKIHKPTLDEITDFGEADYWSLIYGFCATPTDMKWQLHQIGKDWNKMSDYDLFLLMYQSFTHERASIVFGDLALEEFEPWWNNNIEEWVLYHRQTDRVIDRSIYEQIVWVLRNSHNIEKNVEIAMTETTRIVLLEEAEEQYNARQGKQYESALLPLISTMHCMEGFDYKFNEIFDLPINVFLDAVSRIQHIDYAKLLMQSGYSGFGIDLKSIPQKNLNQFIDLSKR